MRIETATTRGDFDLARALVREYAAGLGIDLCFQSFDDELAHLGEMYGPPSGRLLLACCDDESEETEHAEAAGCVALRRLDDGTAEMKRMYVRPAFRGRGIGRMLAVAVLDAAREMGYARVRLDTLPSMGEAQSLYRSLGFVEIAPYYPNPVPGARYLEVAV
jgi:ribosomal protein S18 acetylase RimI-like enzyme